MNKIYNLGIIGYGGMAGNHMKQLSHKNVRVKLKGVFDTDISRLEAAREQGFVAYSSKEELLSDKDIDIVLVATTNETHAELSIEALRAGKHVLCEKPVTLSSAELEEVIKVSEECGKIFTIDQNRRQNRDFINVCRAIERGDIGKPYVIESRVEGSRGMPEGWRCNKAQGGGMMLDWGVHLIDQMLQLNSGRVCEVYCKMYSINYSEVDDNFRLTMTFEDGLTAHIEVSTNNFINHHRFYVLGTDGTMIVTDWDGTGKIVKKISDDETWGVDIKKVKAGPSKTMAPRNPETVKEIALLEPEGVIDNLDPVYEQLVNAIEGMELKIKPSEAMRVMKVMEAAFESNDKKEVIKRVI